MKSKKMFYIIGGVFLALIIIGIITTPSTKNSKTVDDKKTVNSQTNKKPHNIKTKKEQPKPDKAKEQPRSDLASRVNKDLLKNLGYDSYQQAGAPFEYITGIKNNSDGWVIVNYQNTCEKSEATNLARQIVGMTELDIHDLKTVSVICTNGTASYANRDSWAK